MYIRKHKKGKGGGGKNQNHPLLLQKNAVTFLSFAIVELTTVKSKYIRAQTFKENKKLKKKRIVEKTVCY
jgi:hypothetical protein